MEKTNPSDIPLYAVADDPGLLQILRSLGIPFASTLPEFRDRLQDAGFQPAMVLVQHTYAGFSGEEALQEIAQLQDRLPSIFAMAMKEDDAQQWLEMVQLGVEYLLAPPYTSERTQELLKTSQAALRARKSRILIIHAEPNYRTDLAKQLTHMGMEVTTLEDEKNCEEALTKVDPHIFLLDSQLPCFSSRHLLETLRADARRAKMLIGLTVHEGTDLETIDHAFGYEADELYDERLPPIEMRRRLWEFARSHAEFVVPTSTDFVTGFLTAQGFKEYLKETFWPQAERETYYLLALIEVDQFRFVRACLGHLRKNELLATARLLLTQILGRWLSVSYFGKGRFAVLVKEFSRVNVQEEARRMLGTVPRELALAGKHALRLTFSGAMTLFQAPVTTPEQLLQETEALGQEIKLTGGDDLRLIDLVQRSKPPTKKEVIIIDSDRDLCEILAFAYAQHGYAVQTKQTGQEALQYFATRPKVESKLLIVLDRVLPDMDGLEILKGVKECDSLPHMAIFLSPLTSESELLEGFKQGAIDCVPKPLNIDVLIRKSETLLLPK